MSESQCCILERVARAMWFDHVDLQGYPNGCPTWDEMLLMPSGQGVVEEVRSNARAAIRAMLEGLERDLALTELANVDGASADWLDGFRAAVSRLSVIKEAVK